MVNLERADILWFYFFIFFYIYLFIYLFIYFFVYLKVNLDLEKTNHLGEYSPIFIFATVNIDPVVIENSGNDGES